MKFSEFIRTDSILVSLASRQRDEAIRELVANLAAVGAIEASVVDEIVAAIIKREKNGSTGFGKGVAVPHVKHARISKLVGTVGLSAEGLEFSALDHKPVHSVFILLSPLGKDQDHLAAMDVVFRQLNKDTFRRSLRQADTRETIASLLADADAGK